jgi:hypothetical protein
VKLAQISVFRDISIRTAGECQLREGPICVHGNDQDASAWVLAADRLDDLHPMPAGQVEVQENAIGRPHLERPHKPIPIRSGRNDFAFPRQHPRQGLADQPVVVDQDQPRPGHQAHTMFVDARSIIARS